MQPEKGYVPLTSIIIIYYHYDYFEAPSCLPELIQPAFWQLRQLQSRFFAAHKKRLNFNPNQTHIALINWRKKEK
jgi:hypothetical protein